MSGWLRHCAVACFFNLLLLFNAVAAPHVWIVLSEESGSYQETATVLRAELAGSAEIFLSGGPFLLSEQKFTPDLIVTVGVAALDGVLDHLEKRGWQGVQVLATLLPQSAVDARQSRMPNRAGAFSAVVLDQPVSRQMALIRRALPGRDALAVPLGPHSRASEDTVKRQAAAHGLLLIPTPVINQADEIFSTFRTGLESAQVILALPDATVYNPASLQNILLMTYRARVPLIAFSPAYVKAGALVAVYSTPAQVARRTARAVRALLTGRPIPALMRPDEFEVATNPRVAASLGLTIDDADAIARDLRGMAGGGLIAG